MKNVFSPSEMRSITMRDKSVFQTYFQPFRQPLADMTFTMRYIWARSMKHTWKFINGNLCVFGFFNGRHVVWGPPFGGTRLGETIDECFNIVTKLNEQKGIYAKPGIIYIPEAMKPAFQQIAGAMDSKLGYWTQDYIYRTKDLLELKGAAYDSQRHKINFFMKNYRYTVENFDWNQHARDCMHLVDLWKNHKEEVIDKQWLYQVRSEANAAKRAVRFSHRLGIRGIVLKVDGQIAGVSLGEALTPSMCSNIIEKTNPVINGASEFIFREFAKQWSSCSFINVQDDFGVEYLKRVKLSYRPAKLLRSYCLQKK